jgi:hypothetical protein
MGKGNVAEVKVGERRAPASRDSSSNGSARADAPVCEEEGCSAEEMNERDWGESRFEEEESPSPVDSLFSLPSARKWGGAGLESEIVIFCRGGGERGEGKREEIQTKALNKC